MRLSRAATRGSSLTKRVIGELTGLLLPRGCAGCDRPDALLCPDCARLLTRPVFSEAPSYALGQALACGAYRGPVRRAILAWKDHDDRALDRPLGHAISLLTGRLLAGGRFRAGLPSGTNGTPILVVPAPSTPRSLRRRGRAHLNPVVAAVARTLMDAGFPSVSTPVLTMHDIRGKSVGAGGRSERASRVSGRIVVRDASSVVGHPILVIDDIVTTGSTIRQCARALTLAGGIPLTCLTLAAATGVDPGIQRA